MQSCYLAVFQLFTIFWPIEFESMHMLNGEGRWLHEVLRIRSKFTKRKVQICSTNKRISLDSYTLWHLASFKLQDN
jgi:hypothetical protein